MVAKVDIRKSFDDGRGFLKDWENGDFEQFFKVEGQYLDKLAVIMEEHAKEGDTFTVTYTVTVTA